MSAQNNKINDDGDDHRDASGDQDNATDAIGTRATPDLLDTGPSAGRAFRPIADCRAR